MKNIALFVLLLFPFSLFAQETSNPASDGIEMFNVENPAVQAFMSDSTYFRTNDYRVSVVRRYYDPELYGAELDYSRGKTVAWHTSTPSDSIREIRITLSERGDFADSLTFRPEALTDTMCTVYNLIPARTYYYKVEEVLLDNRIRLLCADVFKTTGQVRMIRAQGTRNMRDIGGWMTSFGLPIRYGKLFRSGSMDAVKATGRHDLVENLRIGAELDLRGESKLKESRLGEDVDFIRIVTEGYMGGLERRSEALANDIQWVIARLRDGRNVDWHCAIGCDRCGTVSFLIEGVLGMSDVDICRDYELSSMRGHKRYRSSGGFHQMFAFIRKYGPEDDLAQCFYNYLVSIGVPADDLDYLRLEMLDFTSIPRP